MSCFTQINDERKSMGTEYGRGDIYIKCGDDENSIVRSKSQKGSKSRYFVDKINAKAACFLTASKNLIINAQLPQTHTKISSEYSFP